MKEDHFRQSGRQGKGPEAREHVLDSQFSKRANAAEGELERKRITEMTSKRQEESTRCTSFRPAAPNILGTSDFLEETSGFLEG